MRDASVQAASITPSASPMRRWLFSLGLNAAIAAVYAALGIGALMAIVPPDAAAPVYPAAGLAAAAVLRWGARVLPGIVIGSLAVNLLPEMRSASTLPGYVLIALAAAVQAWLGVWLARRWVGPVPRLTEPREVLRFYGAVAGLACVVGPSVGVAVLSVSGSVPAGTEMSHWLSWWLGDAIGVMLVTPLALSLFGLPRSHWAPRRLSVALPMMLACGLLIAASYYVALNEEARRRHAFDLEAEATLDVLSNALQRPLTALEANHSLLTVAPSISRAAFERAHAERLLGSESVYALGWSVRVPAAKRDAFERAARMDGYPSYHLHERSRPGDLQVDPKEDILAIRLIVPFHRNQNALGVNVRAIPQGRAAQDLAIATGLPYAAEGFPLSQDVGARAVGVVIYRAVYEDGGQPGDPMDDPARAHSHDVKPRPRGLAFATLRPEALLYESMPPQATHLDFCLMDRTPQTRQVLLAGDDRCLTLPADMPSRQQAVTHT